MKSLIRLKARHIHEANAVLCMPGIWAAVGRHACTWDKNERATSCGRTITAADIGHNLFTIPLVVTHAANKSQCHSDAAKQAKLRIVVADMCCCF
jgi:hypothetical protein